MRLSIVMYHYVRDLKRSRFPAIKGLPVEEFAEQLGYLKKHYNLVSGEEVLDAVQAGATDSLPDRAALLTFDDGYLDHFTCAFPVMDRLRVRGCFFPPARCVLEKRVLDVNKIHFVLAAAGDPGKLVQTVLEMVDANRAQYGLEPGEAYLKKYAVASHQDPKEVMFVKRMLQKGLPGELRNRIVDSLFATWVTSDETAFASELYMTEEQITCLRRGGMTIGSHGYAHEWLDTLDAEGQRREVDLSLEFLRGLGVRLDRWMMCYPYGAWNEPLVQLLKSRGCGVGLLTKPGIADLRRDNPLTLPRLDTNQLPKAAGASPNEWTQQAAGA
jgi:peptidoglycan/xylan/chitin deacetylase (PgdA/CDA1 family)